MKDEKGTKTVDLLGIQHGNKNPVGRPRKHDSSAARQQAYRKRMKMDGKRVVTKVTIDRRCVSDEITSDIIVIPLLYRTRPT